MCVAYSIVRCQHAVIFRCYGLLQRGTKQNNFQCMTFDESQQQSSTYLGSTPGSVLFPRGGGSYWADCSLYMLYMLYTDCRRD